MRDTNLAPANFGIGYIWSFDIDYSDKLYGSLKYGNAHNISKNIVYGGDVNERHPVHLNCIIFNLPARPFFEEEDGLASSAQGIPVQDHHSSLLWLCTDLHDTNPKDYTSMFSGTSASESHFPLKALFVHVISCHNLI